MRRTSTVIARFRAGISKESITTFFEQQDIDGVCVSDTLNRYAIEVPSGKEKQYIQLFRECGLFSNVQDHCLGGERPSTPLKTQEETKLRPAKIERPAQKPGPQPKKKSFSFKHQHLRGGI